MTKPIWKDIAGVALAEGDVVCAPRSDRKPDHPETHTPWMDVCVVESLWKFSTKDDLWVALRSLTDGNEGDHHAKDVVYVEALQNAAD